MPFIDRHDAGLRLAAALARYRDQKPVVLALPRGGVPVAAEVAAALDAPLDLLLVRKIGVPMQPELAMGAVVDGDRPIVVRNDDVINALAIDEGTFLAACDRELMEIDRRRERYLRGRSPIDVTDRVVIVIDDGIATGATVRAGLKAIRERRPNKLVLAVPVAPPAALDELRPHVDDLVCLESHRFFGAIGAYYNDFQQLTDDEVVMFVDGAAKRSHGSVKGSARQ